MTFAKFANVMINRMLIKFLAILLLLLLNCAPHDWMMKKYREYSEDLHYVELFLNAYKQIQSR